MAKSTRNEFEFMSMVLDALGVEHTEADAKNEERWRAKMLDGLEVEYNQNDVNQFDLFRAKLVEGVESKSEGGGGSSDFSTAKLTIKNTNPNLSEAKLSFPYIFEGVLGGATWDLLMDFEQGDFVQDIALYNGEAYIELGLASTGGFPSASLSGGISGSVPQFTITGDCTITIS